MRHSAMKPRRLPAIRINLAAGDKALDKNESLPLARKDRPANENTRSRTQEGMLRRLYLLFAKH